MTLILLLLLTLFGKRGIFTPSPLPWYVVPFQFHIFMLLISFNLFDVRVCMYLVCCTLKLRPSDATKCNFCKAPTKQFLTFKPTVQFLKQVLTSLVSLKVFLKKSKKTFFVCLTFQNFFCLKGYLKTIPSVYMSNSINSKK